MDIADHLDQLDGEGARLAAVLAATSPDAPVPSCPEWALRDLAFHLGGVHRWATAFVAGSHTEPGQVDFATQAGPRPSDAALAEWVVAGHAALVTTLRDTSPDLACWTFMPAPSPLAFWARRQAHETTIHRVDAELAARRSPTPVTTAFGADGVDEFLTGFVPRRRANRTDEPPRTLAISCADAPDRWHLTLGPDPAAHRGDGVEAADCVVEANASDLFYAVWNRHSTAGFSLKGDAAVFEQLLGRARS